MLIARSNMTIQNQWRVFSVNVAPQHGMQLLDILRMKTATLRVLKNPGMVVHSVRNMNCGSSNIPVNQVCVRTSLCVLYYKCKYLCDSCVSFKVSAIPVYVPLDHIVFHC